MKQVIDPEITDYESFLRARDGAGLASFEREMLRGFLYWRLRGPPSA